MIHNSESKSVNFNQNATIRLRKKLVNEDGRERTRLWQASRYYSTGHLMQPTSSILASEDRLSAHHPSPQALAEKAAIILALNVTSGKKPNQS